MKDKTVLFHFPVLLGAAWALFRLAGLPEQLHITPVRLLLMVLILICCGAWFGIFRQKETMTARPGSRSLIFHAALLTAAISVVMAVTGAKLAGQEGLLYRIGAFLRQAKPFLLFLSVLSLSTALLIFSVFRHREQDSLVKLLTEDRSIPESLLIFIACLLVYGAFFPLRANYYPSHDSGIFAYIGQQILRGKIPYTQLWDHKPPVIFYLNALGLKLGGGSLVGVWVLELAAFFIGALILFRLMKKSFPEWISLIVLFLGILHYPQVLDFGNYTEEVSLFFAVCSLGLFFSGKSSPLKGFLCGILCGLAFTCKQNTIGCWIGLFLLDGIRTLQAGKASAVFRDRLKYWLCAAAGFILVNLAWAGYFAVNHALKAYWDVAFRFNFIYSEHSTDSRLACALTTLTFLPSVCPFLLLGSLSWFLPFISIFRKQFTDLAENNSLTVWAWIALPVELFFAGLSGMNYQHYFILCITPMLILLCYALDRLTQIIRLKINFYKVWIAVILAAATLPMIPVYRANYMPRTPSSYTKVRTFLLNETIPEEPILVWGSRSAIYVMSERHAPTAYFNERPLYLFPGEIRSAQWDELLRDISSDPPQVIIYTHDSALPFIEQNENGCIIPSGEEYTIPVYEYFCENYSHETTISPEFQDAWDIYRRDQH